jgi:hypothetical protein
MTALVIIVAVITVITAIVAITIIVALTEIVNNYKELYVVARKLAYCSSHRVTRNDKEVVFIAMQLTS